MNDIFLSLRGISKNFLNIKALDDFSMDIYKGKVHCIAGQNGSGKSTLIKIISGIYRPDSGKILIGKDEYKHIAPLDAIKAGVQVIYQDFSLFPNLSVAENLLFNYNIYENKKIVNWKKIYHLAQKALDNLNLTIDLDTNIESLSVAQKQLVAIARAMCLKVKLLIMDEPTTALTQKEIKSLFETIKDIKKSGVAVVFVSHKLEEMQEISDSMIILRNGKKIKEGMISDFNEDNLTYHMTGKKFSISPYSLDMNSNTPRLKVADWKIGGNLNFTNNLTLYKKEIVGLMGLMGSGRTNFALSLFGLIRHNTGEIEIDEKTVSIKDVNDAIKGGIAYVPEDRLSEGLFLTQSIEKNCLSASYDKLMNRFSLNFKLLRYLPKVATENLSIKIGKLSDCVDTLSGGNQQRVVIAKWLLRKPKVLILNRPTVGVDIGSKNEIHQKIRELAMSKEISVLMISDDIPELLANCNRILIMHKGEILENFETRDISYDDVKEKLKELK